MAKTITPAALLSDEIGNWWADERRRWCAYCGQPMRLRWQVGKPVPPQKSTRDHLIPRAHGGSKITIPACRGCNSAKGKLSVSEFLASPAFNTIREHKHTNRWPLHVLWQAVALAALDRAETERQRNKA